MGPNKAPGVDGFSGNFFKQYLDIVGMGTLRDGGIGIRNMHLFNIALLGNQVWRFVNNKDFLCFKVLSSKYFPEGNIFKAKCMNKPSFTWSSIVVAVEKLKNGFGWQVGNGDCINIQVDNWGMKNLNGGTFNSNMINSVVNIIRDLWVVNKRKWDIDKVYLMYCKDWGDRICNLSIGNEGQRDRIVWFHNPYGCYTSKSAYSWLLPKKMGFDPHRFYWKAI
ncbi:hypothetical protein PVK06_025044 [Gossypium arboreum]|uniref:Reverse transcriptase n=1 Tax=Gossypium arboreum TaxID=29729 RepID=A0ABR0PFK7_GOSAR|nr:hypothetical protein PVK06_025044 [Gossypium arboreum]